MPENEEDSNSDVKPSEGDESKSSSEGFPCDAGDQAHDSPDSPESVRDIPQDENMEDVEPETSQVDRNIFDVIDQSLLSNVGSEEHTEVDTVLCQVSEEDLTAQNALAQTPIPYNPVYPEAKLVGETHKGMMIYKCHLCSYNGRSWKSYVKHYQAHRQKYKMCHLCSRAFERPSDLKRHLERHEKDANAVGAGSGSLPSRPQMTMFLQTGNTRARYTTVNNAAFHHTCLRGWPYMYEYPTRVGTSATYVSRSSSPRELLTVTKLSDILLTSYEWTPINTVWLLALGSSISA